MALRKNNEGENAAADNVAVAEATETPAFEGMDTEIGSAQEQVVENAVAVASTAIARAQSTAVAAPKKRAPLAALNEFKDVIGQDEVLALGIGTFPRITVDQGGFNLDKNTDLGKEIRFKLISYNERYMVVTGSNDDEAKKKVKVSYDGETIAETGELVSDVIAAWKAEGYTDACSKLYYDVWAYLSYASGKEIPEEDQKMVQLQLSPQSVKQFKGFQIDLGLKRAMGKLQLDDEPLIFARGEKQILGSNTFGVVKFSLK